MFDLSSFLSGVVGALIGGGVALLLAQASATERRKDRRQVHADEVATALSALARARDSAEKEVDGVWRDGVGDAIDDVNRAIARLGASCRGKDRSVLSWLSALVLEIVGHHDKVDRRAIVAQARISIAQWQSNDLSTSWFKEASGAISERWRLTE